MGRHGPGINPHGDIGADGKRTVKSETHSSQPRWVAATSSSCETRLTFPIIISTKEAFFSGTWLVKLKYSGLPKFYMSRFTISGQFPSKPYI